MRTDQNVMSKWVCNSFLIAILLIGLLPALTSCDVIVESRISDSIDSGTVDSGTDFDSITDIQQNSKSEAEVTDNVEDSSAQVDTETDVNLIDVYQLQLELNIVEDLRPDLAHGEKPSQSQKYIVLHDTEGDSSPKDVVSWWDSNGNLVAAHFVIGKDGSIVQCVPLDQIAHHAGYGDVGNNEKFGVAEDGRDDMLGSQPIGSAYPDYGMNAWSIGIELVHIGGTGGYPLAQLESLDKLIAYLDVIYCDSPCGNAGSIIDHKAWRAFNSDTSLEFADYLMSYQNKRTHT